MELLSGLVRGTMIAYTTWKFGYCSGLPKRVVFATWDLNRFRYGTLVVSVIGLWSLPRCATLIASATCDLNHLRYIGPVFASATSDLLPSASCLGYEIFVASVGHLRYVGLLSPQLVNSAP